MSEFHYFRGQITLNDKKIGRLIRTVLKLNVDDLIYAHACSKIAIKSSRVVSR